MEVGVSEHAAFPASSLRSVQRLLWEVISERLRDAERDEVKRAIGSLLVEDNQALFAEASALADILGDVQLNTSALLSRKQLCSNPERSMVEADILLVMDRLRSMATTAAFASSAAKDRNPDSIVPKAEAQDKAVYEYMQASTATQAVGERPNTAWLRPSTASSRPLTASSMSRPSTASSVASASTVLDPMHLVSCVQGKLSVFGIDDVKDAVRCALQEEHTALLNDIDYLTALLTDEADMQLKAAAPPPTLHQLKQYSKKLKSLVEAEQGRLQHELVVSKMFNAAQAEASKAGKLRRMVGASREPLPTAAPQLLHPPPTPNQRGLERLASRTSLNRTEHLLFLPPSCSAAPSSCVPAIPVGQGLTSSSSSPDSMQAAALSSGASASSTGTAAAGQQQPRATVASEGRSSTGGTSLKSSSTSQPTTSQNQSAFHTVDQWPPSAPMPSITSAASEGGDVPMVQRSSTGRRHIIQALRASSAASASSTREQSRPFDNNPAMVPSIGALQGVEQHGLSPRQPSPTTALQERSMPAKLAAVDLLDARAETLKGGVAAILAKHNYKQVSRPAPAEPG